MFWYIWFFSLSWLDTEEISWAVFERKTVQTTIAMHHFVMRSFPLEAIEHCSRKWIPLNWKIYSLEVLKKALTENKDNLAIVCSNLEKNKNIQELVDAVYERCNTAMGEYWMRFMKIFNILLQNVNICDTGNQDEYLSCSRTMQSWMLKYNNHDHGRWLPDYCVMINSLQYDEKTLLVSILLSKWLVYHTLISQLIFGLK